MGVKPLVAATRAGTYHIFAIKPQEINKNVRKLASKTSFRTNCGGEEGIRTLDTLMGYTRFPIVRARPTTRLLRVCSSSFAYSLVSLPIIIHAIGKVKQNLAGTGLF